MQHRLLATGVLLLTMGMGMATAQNVTKAFPGAEGFGQYTKGGRGGEVYHVTTLDDGMQPGTLRWANAQEGPKTIVFDVSGTIYLKSPLHFTRYTTVAGQTAPGDGICVADYPVSVSTENIIRYMRFRLGNREVAHHDGDGMPDNWERAHGLNPHDATDGKATAADGYTNLEHYLNSIVSQ